jgi:hypothetical protein
MRNDGVSALTQAQKRCFFIVETSISQDAFLLMDTQKSSEHKVMQSKTPKSANF